MTDFFSEQIDPVIARVRTYQHVDTCLFAMHTMCDPNAAGLFNTMHLDHQQKTVDLLWTIGDQMRELAGAIDPDVDVLPDDMAVQLRRTRDNIMAADVRGILLRLHEMSGPELRAALVFVSLGGWADYGRAAVYPYYVATDRLRELVYA